MRLQKRALLSPSRGTFPSPQEAFSSSEATAVKASGRGNQPNEEDTFVSFSFFIVLMAWRLDEWASLPTSIIVMFANSVYIVALTAFLMGLRPNKAIFDASIMIWFWIGTVLPLLGLFLLSFTQGDVSLYGNWWERASQDGLAATAQMYDETMVQQGYMGMIAISIGLILASALLWKLMDTRWGRSEFSN